MILYNNNNIIIIIINKTKQHNNTENDIIIIIIITGWVKGSGNLYYNKSYLIYMQCSFAMLTNDTHTHTHMNMYPQEVVH